MVEQHASQSCVSGRDDRSVSIIIGREKVERSEPQYAGGLGFGNDMMH